jgi:uncharacterized protein with PQ loop repeat
MSVDRYDNNGSVTYAALAVFFQTIGYLHQLYRMIRKRSPDLFNPSTALILLLSHFLRFLFILYESLGSVVLSQSIIMFCLQLSMIFASFYYEAKRLEKFTPLRPRWHWVSLKDYINIRKIHSSPDFVISLFVHAVCISIAFGLSILVLGVDRASLIVLVLSIILEMISSFPQFVCVVVCKDISAVSLVLMLQYLLGDWCRLFVFRWENSGWLFVVGSIVQIAIDSTVAVSYFIQRRNPRPTERIETLPLISLL